MVKCRRCFNALRGKNESCPYWIPVKNEKLARIAHF